MDSAIAVASLDARLLLRADAAGGDPAEDRLHANTPDDERFSVLHVGGKACES